MKKSILVLVFLIGGLANAQSVSLEVKVTGFKNDTGKVRVGLYNSEFSFLKTIYKSQAVAIKNETANVIFSDLPKGEYAISLYHDENNNGILDKNMFGIPSEDYAASNQAKGVMGPPKYTDAKFTINTNSKINIILNN